MQQFCSSVLHLSRVEFVLCVGRNKGYSDAVLSSAMASWSQATHEQYECSWRQLQAYVKGSRTAAASPSVSVMVANFLQDRCDSGLSPDYVGNMRSAISTTLELTTGAGLAEDAWVRRTLKGQGNLHVTSTSKPSEYFDLDVLFHKMLSWDDNYAISDERLQVKLVMLLRVAILGRSADAAAVIHSKSYLDVEGLHLVLGRLKPDKSYTEHPLPVVEWLGPDNAKVCLCSVYDVYCKRTLHARKEMLRKPLPPKKLKGRYPCVKDRLILGRDAGNCPIRADRVATISAAFLAECGVDMTVYRSHHVRGAVGTAMIDAGVDPADVLSRGRWRSLAVFKQFYERSRQRAQMPATLMASIAGIDTD